jgi:hypothetical protein
MKHEYHEGPKAGENFEKLAREGWGWDFRPCHWGSVCRPCLSPLGNNLVYPKKDLTSNYYWGTANEVGRMTMANAVNTEYAWTHATDDPDIPKRSVTVLHVPPAISPITADRGAIMQELQELRANADIEAEPS